MMYKAKQRKIYAINLTYEVPSIEKDQANKAIMAFNYVLKTMKACNEHLDLIHTPFKDTPDLSPEQAYTARAALRRYRDKMVDNFNSLKKQCFRCFMLLQPFSVDTQVVKLSKSFTLCIEDIEKQVNRLVESFSNLESKEFSQVVVKAVENIKKEMAELNQIIEDRILTHLQNNILAKNWVDNVSDELQEKIETKIPLSVQLVNERTKNIENKEKR